jgi:hypothetical protein
MLFFPLLGRVPSSMMDIYTCPKKKKNPNDDFPFQFQMIVFVSMGSFIMAVFLVAMACSRSLHHCHAPRERVVGTRMLPLRVREYGTLGQVCRMTKTIFSKTRYGSTMWDPRNILPGGFGTRIIFLGVTFWHAG